VGTRIADTRAADQTYQQRRWSVDACARESSEAVTSRFRSTALFLRRVAGNGTDPLPHEPSLGYGDCEYRVQLSESVGFRKCPAAYPLAHILARDKRHSTLDAGLQSRTAVRLCQETSRLLVVSRTKAPLSHIRRGRSREIADFRETGGSGLTVCC
jgi:hypothetical protein